MSFTPTAQKGTTPRLPRSGVSPSPSKDAQRPPGVIRAAAVKALRIVAARSGAGGHTEGKGRPARCFGRPSPEVMAMKGNVIQLVPSPTSAPGHVEPLDAAVIEVSARVADNNDERRRLHSRLDELRGLSPSLRRRRARVVPADPSRPVTFYSIEVASDVAAGAHGRTSAHAFGGLR